MSPLLVVIIVLGAALLVTTAYMEWVGVMNVVTPRAGPRHEVCGHLRINPASRDARCWRCRHAAADRALRALHH